MTTPKTEKLIVNYLTNQASLNELDELAICIQNPANEKAFISYVKTNYVIDYNMKKFDTKRSKKQLLEYINKEKKVYRLRKRQTIYKYAAAASIVLLISIGYFFKDNIFTSPVDKAPIIVNKSNKIESGTDKATLTLADGSVIELEKGKAYQTKNASSNGEQIVYDASNNEATEIAYNYLTIPRGGQYFIKLSDGTQVWLNSESQLKYPVSFIDGETRKVELVYGEAYFDVSPSTEHDGADFKVYQNKQEIQVLGTEFNIKAYKDETNIYTTLVEGKVAVIIESNTQNLSPNQQSSFNLDTNSLTIKTVDVYNEISWKEGVFSFDGKSLKEIMKVLSRWYDMDVVFKDKTVENVEFIGILDKNQNIKEILTSIKNFGVIKDYDIKDKKIVLE